ncbi:MAG: histidine kinase [Clostridium sp.]|uniref:sensor histidine kinase n=1 Tax=Butyribacter sp. TaxID=2822465 RepID=UPI002A9E88E9|nr:histidine kinase [Clostridium sp.]MDY5180665.1 histidine kinase [Butyribacter sp.]
MLIDKSKRYRDDSTEINLLLKEKNKNLLINQNYEINNATLTERNRIAREIHDNVGHMLSRAIMITGAIKVVNKNENLYNSIDNLEECLSNAMTNIRESVHNLHNNSISLQNTVQKIVDDFKFCNINLTYDMTDHIPNDVKYAFITIIKESLTNIEKHSNATSAKLTLREHPAMYQLIIHDNGSIISEFDSSIYDTENYLSTSTGIGLNNIYSRIHMLKGTIKIYTDNGFCIFISVPKGEKHEYSNS